MRAQAFQDHVKKVLASDKMKQATTAAQPFFKDVHDFVFGREASMENMVSMLFVRLWLHYLTFDPAQRTRNLLRACFSMTNGWAALGLHQLGARAQRHVRAPSSSHVHRAGSWLGQLP